MLNTNQCLYLPQSLAWHKKDPGHSAKSAGGRLHLWPKHTYLYTPLIRQSQSGLTTRLAPIRERRLHTTHQITLVHSHLCLLNNCGLIFAWSVGWVHLDQIPLKQTIKAQLGNHLLFFPLNCRTWGKNPQPPTLITRNDAHYRKKKKREKEKNIVEDSQLNIRLTVILSRLLSVCIFLLCVVMLVTYWWQCVCLSFTILIWPLWLIGCYISGISQSSAVVCLSLHCFTGDDMPFLAKHGYAFIISRFFMTCLSSLCDMCCYAFIISCFIMTCLSSLCDICCYACIVSHFMMTACLSWLCDICHYACIINFIMTTCLSSLCDICCNACIISHFMMTTCFSSWCDMCCYTCIVSHFMMTACFSLRCDMCYYAWTISHL